MRLSPRELQVAQCFCEAMSNREVAEKLGMATRTVKAHAQRLYIRFGLAEVTGSKRVKLAVLLHRSGICKTATPAVGR